ncbi:chitinase [Sarocladium strictum]
MGLIVLACISTGCQSTCDRKSQCNPGWSSSRFSEQDDCPLNVCCSEHGFCGYTDEFCKDDKVDRPSCSNGHPVDRVIGYWESWSTSQRSCMSMAPETIPYGQFTDIIFSFATINPETFRISPGNKATDSMMARIGAMKLIQPGLKIWIAIGGWAFNDPGPTQTTFSDIARSASNTETFLESLVSLMNKYNFDGVDIDWEYPVAPDRNGRPEDYKNAVTFMTKLKTRMEKNKKQVSMAIPASYWYLQNFDIQALEATVDWFNLMTYDVHGSWDIDNQWTGPWANSHTNMTEIQMGLDLMWRNGISPNKVTMGMAFYSRSFTLTNAASCSGVGCRVASAGDPGRCSDTAGVLLHPEIAEIIKEHGLTPQLHRDAAVKTISWGDQWTSFDDVATWRLKANIARSQCITGFMVWAISHDDEQGTNAKSLNQALGREIPDFPDFGFVPAEPPPAPVMLPKLCRWTSCYDDCPSGFKAVQRDGHEEIMLDARMCKHISFPNRKMSKLCCPNTIRTPKCTWRGHRNSGNCKPGCDDGEIEIGTLQAGCKKGFQTACCESTQATAAYGECYWTGCVKKDSPSWGDHCLQPYSKFIVESDRGSGDMPKCQNGERRVMCCRDPAPFEFTNNCQWVRKAGFVADGNYCEGACPKGSFRISLRDGTDSPGWCWDTQAYCCDDPKPVVIRGPEYDEGDVWGADGMMEFRHVLEKYMRNPTCPATILQPSIDGTATPPAWRRSLVAEAQEFDMLHKRATDCTESDWRTLVNYVNLMFDVKAPAYIHVTNYYDSEFAATFDPGLSFNNLTNYFRDYPDIAPRAHIEMMLLAPVEAADSMRNMRSSGSALCEPRSLSRVGPEADVDIAVDKRLIFVPGSRDEEHITGVPDFGEILRGINRGDITLHYARWQWYRGRRAGPMLELAYWIGPQIGVRTHQNAYYNRYRDVRVGNQVPDHWVVMHIHIDVTTRQNWLRRFPDGNTHVGTGRISLFHGQRWMQPVSIVGWRVNGNAERLGTIHASPNADRSGWECPGNQVWYIGRDPPGRPDEFTNLLARWGRNLYLDHYVNVAGLRMVIEAPPGTNPGVLDPRNPGTIVPEHSQSTVAQGEDPYDLNWVVAPNPSDGTLMFDFNIDPPDRDLESGSSTQNPGGT